MREQEGEDAGGGAREGEETAHAHHARRPMNAFLIFCKRHRGVVRDKYPNLENRSITKILGEWWANLDEEEKACYTGLAKQYKDAFFSANPDFKWYKLPAPPLRTLAARPSAAAVAERERAGDAAHAHHPRHRTPEPCEPLRTNNNSTKYDYNKRRAPSCDEAPLSMFTPGKLADEAHMGGLSSLISSNTKPDPSPYLHLGYSTPYAAADGDALYTSQYTERPKHRSKEDSIRELQNALSETTRIFEDLDGKPKESPEAENFDDRNFTNQEIIDQVIDRGLLKEEHEAKAEWPEGDRTSRSGRSCKGKRYQEFMAVNGLLAGKRSRRDERDGAYAYGAPDWDYSGRGDGSHSPEDVDAPLKGEYAASPPPAAEDVAPEPNENESEAKPFRPADFDLDAKIRALPSLSLEKFQEKKRENKRKKKSGFGIKPKESPARYGGGGGGGAGWPQQRAAAPRAEPWREVVSGSQKRKPRKISITRLEVHSMVNRTGEVKSSPEMKLATEAPRGMEAEAAGVGAAAGVPVDLFALATLAEVAASTSKMEEGAPTDARYQYQV